MVKEFDVNLNKSIFWSQVDDNTNGKLNNTWDIFWYSFIFINKGLCLTPKVSMTRNIGHDGSGIHSTMDRDYLFSKVNEENIVCFPETIQENRYCLKKIRKYLKKKNSIFSRLLRKFLIFLIVR